MLALGGWSSDHGSGRAYLERSDRERAGARSDLVTERCDDTSVQKIRCFTRLPSDHIQYGHGDSRRPQLSRGKRGDLFSFFLDYFPSLKKWGGGIMATEKIILLNVFTVDFGWAEVWVGFYKDFNGETPSPRRTSLLSKVDELEECLGEGPLDFTIVQEKIALRFFSPRNRPEGAGDGGEFQVLSCGGGVMKNIANNLSACLLGTWRRQHLCLSRPLLKSYFTFFFFWMDLFFCKKGRKERRKWKRFVKVVASFSRGKKLKVQTWRPSKKELEKV